MLWLARLICTHAAFLFVTFLLEFQCAAKSKSKSKSKGKGKKEQQSKNKKKCGPVKLNVEDMEDDLGTLSDYELGEKQVRLWLKHPPPPPQRVEIYHRAL